MNHTQNYQLSQWVKSDKVQMEDFNADNAKIDGALKAQADVLAAHGEVLAGLSNCRVHFTSYVGNGVCELSHSPRIALPGVPVVLVIFGGGCLTFQIPEQGNVAYVFSTGRSGILGITWEGNTATLEQHTSNNSADVNRSLKYYVAAIYFAQ